jgi:glycosyltransferase involved in cell wall biosynthesis
MNLSILICTLPKRIETFTTLHKFLKRQLYGLEDYWRHVEILVNDRPDITTGAKRNLLLEEAKGEFVVFIDDDDWVSDLYIYHILRAIVSNPSVDCIGINGWITENGGPPKKWFISKDYQRWFEQDNIFYRTPNHISPVRRSIALNAKFPDVSFSEDAAYSQLILPHLSTEIKIEPELYYYRFVADKSKIN